MVMVHHFHNFWVGNFGIPFFVPHKDNVLTNEGVLVTNFLHNGSFGVEVFFIISGFLITYLLLEEKKRYQKINLLKFYTRRALRIWPVYFLILAITPYIIQLLSASRIKYLGSLFFLSNYELISAKDWNLFPISHIWSICVEEHFYLILPFLIVYIPSKHLPSVFATLIVMSIGYRFYINAYNPDWMRLYLDTGCRADTLLIGSLLGYYHHHNTITLSVSRWIRVLVLFTLIFLLSIEDINYWQPHINAGFKKYAYIILAVFLISNFLFNTKPLIPLHDKGILKYLGKISYGIYMYGNLITPIIFSKYFIHHRDTANFLLFLIIYFVCVILISVLSYELYEKLFLKLKSRLEILKTR